MISERIVRQGHSIEDFDFEADDPDDGDDADTDSPPDSAE
jgi:hypothetical protein